MRKPVLHCEHTIKCGMHTSFFNVCTQNTHIHITVQYSSNTTSFYSLIICTSTTQTRIKSTSFRLKSCSTLTYIIHVLIFKSRLILLKATCIRQINNNTNTNINRTFLCFNHVHDHDTFLMLLVKAQDRLRLKQPFILQELWPFVRS